MNQDPPPPDPLDAICRQMWAETMRPCRELTRAERAEQREEAAERNAFLASTNSAPELRVA